MIAIMSSLVSIEQELQGRIPRYVVFRDRDIALVTRFREFVTLLLIWGAVLVIAYAVLGFYVLHNGKPMPGSVIRKWEIYGRSRSFHIDYMYSYAGIPLSGSESVSYADYCNMYEGETVTIKILDKYPNLIPLLMVSTEERSAKLGGIYFYTVVIVAVALFFWWATFLFPARQKRIYAYGTPTIGQVIRKIQDERPRDRRYERWNSTTNDYTDIKEYIYYVVYRYRTERGDQHEGSMLIPNDAWNDVETGDKVTVLYLPEKPSTSVLYKYGPFQVNG